MMPALVAGILQSIVDVKDESRVENPGDSRSPLTTEERVGDKSSAPGMFSV